MAKSPKGNNSVAIINRTENYDDLRNALSRYLQRGGKLDYTECRRLNFSVKHFLCSDLKFLAIICGIESATSTFPYEWCTCFKSDTVRPIKKFTFRSYGMVSLFNYIRARYTVQLTYL